jgi:hypothetical protein
MWLGLGWVCIMLLWLIAFLTVGILMGGLSEKGPR